MTLSSPAATMAAIAAGKYLRAASFTSSTEILATFRPKTLIIGASMQVLWQVGDEAASTRTSNLMPDF
jgi:hypothetical protein